MPRTGCMFVFWLVREFETISTVSKAVWIDVQWRLPEIQSLTLFFSPQLQ